MSLTKEQIIKDVCAAHALPKPRTSQIIETFLEIIKQSFESGEDILISGFGKFCVKDKAKRRGRNPATGKDLALDARRVITFRCSPVLRDKVNANKY